MKPHDFEAKMRKGEYFHSLRIPEGMWTVVRLDGRGFTKMAEEAGYSKPFDAHFNAAMCHTTKTLMNEFNPVFATTHSDEISLAFPPSFDMFDREVEKIVSTTAAMTSVSFSKIAETFATFDSRIWMGTTISDVVDYFGWRMADAARGAINSYAYWYLRHIDGYTKRQATRELHGKNFAEKNELLFSRFELNFNDTPCWQRRGTGFYFLLKQIDGLNPKTGETTKTERRVLEMDYNLPMKEDFRNWLGCNMSMLTVYPELRGCFINSSETEGKVYHV